MEIEKKYRLTKEQYEQLEKTFNTELEFVSETDEINQLYKGNGLTEKEVLRIRIVNHERFFITYKKSIGNYEGYKAMQEYETVACRPIVDIVNALGYECTIVYPKTRKLWRSEDFPNVFVCLDEVGSEYYLEVEEIEAMGGDDIDVFEAHFGLQDLPVEHRGYPKIVSEKVEKGLMSLTKCIV